MNQFEAIERLIVEGKFAAAEKTLNETPVFNSEDFIVHHILLGEVLYQEERYAESIEVVEEILPLLENEQLLDGLYSLVRNYYGIDKPEKIILYGNTYLSLIRQITNEQVTKDELLCMHSFISEAYHMNGDYDNAITHLENIKELCKEPEDWLLYYDTYAGIMISRDVISCFQNCIAGLKLSDLNNLLEDTDLMLVRLIECCSMVGDFRLAMVIYQVLENNYSEKFGGRIGVIRNKYIPRFSFQYLPRLCCKTAFEEEIKYELKRLNLLP